MSDKVSQAHKDRRRAGNLATDESPPKKRSGGGRESQTADPRPSKRRASFVAQSNAAHTSSDLSSMGRWDTAGSTSAFDQRETAPLNEVLDTTASNLFPSQAYQVSSWNPLTDPFPPITFPIERKEKGLPAAASLASGMSAQSTLVQQLFPYDQQTQRRNGFHLTINDPSDHKTWEVDAPWSLQSRPMVTTQELRKFKDWIPLAPDVAESLKGKYKTSKKSPRVNTLARTLLTTILSTNEAYNNWYNHHSRTPQRFRCALLVNAFFEPGEPSVVLPDIPFQYNMIPELYRTSGSQLETVIRKWMDAIAACPEVEWLTFREESGPTAVDTTLENDSKCASDLPANAFNRDDVPASPLNEESIAAGGVHAGLRASYMPQSSSLAHIIDATSPRAFEEGSHGFLSNDQPSHNCPATVWGQYGLDATDPQHWGIASHFPPYPEGATGPLVPAAGHSQGGFELPGSMSTSHISDNNEFLPLVRDTTAPAFAEGTYSGFGSSTVPRDAMSGHYSYNPDGNAMSSSQASGYLAPRYEHEPLTQPAQLTQAEWNHIFNACLRSSENQDFSPAA